MDINWANLLDEVQDLRAALEAWGVTYEVLMYLGIAAAALFLISLREIVIWYLRISQLQNQMLKMSQQLTQIQATVNQVQVQTEPKPETHTPGKQPVFQESPKAEDDKDEKSNVTALKKFNLDH